MNYTYYESGSTDPAFNLALEEYLFNTLPRGKTCFMLWQNDNAVIVGKYQNTAAEINREYVKEHGIKVIRRLSGGGAVYHDLGNLNYTFISDDGSTSIDFSTFCRPVVQALKALGIEAAANGRNDICIEGRKISGNAQYTHNGRTMHHGTLLFDSDLTKVASSLRPNTAKFQTKAVQSVHSRVTNIKDYLPADIGLHEFKAALKQEILSETDAAILSLSESDLLEIQKLKTSRYDTWEWNYGVSPAYNVVKQQRIDSCGTLELYLNIQKGVIKDAVLLGDFFGNGDITELTKKIIGLPLEKKPLETALSHFPVPYYCHNLSAGQFISLILE